MALMRASAVHALPFLVVCAVGAGNSSECAPCAVHCLSFLVVWAVVAKIWSGCALLQGRPFHIWPFRL